MLVIVSGDTQPPTRDDAAASEGWVHVTDPTPDEVHYLEHVLQVPLPFISHALDSDELARIDHNQTTQLMIVRIPHFCGNQLSVPYITAPLGIILTSSHIITISRFPTDIIITVAQEADLSNINRERISLAILLETAKNYLEHLRIINQAIEITEDRLQLSLRNKELLELLKYQKSLVHFTTSLKSNELMMQRLQKDQFLHLNMRAEDQELLEDVLIENIQASEMTLTASNILSQMMDAFASIISNNLNLVMKFLAAFTVILSFPTVIASIYGMNIDLPLQHSPFAFVGVMVVSVLISLIVVVVFWKRDWL